MKKVNKVSFSALNLLLDQQVPSVVIRHLQIVLLRTLNGSINASMQSSSPA